jgi:hypothetical protein
MQISLVPVENVCERDMQEAALTGGRIESKAGNNALRRPTNESLSLDAYRLTAANNERQGAGSVWDKWTESDAMGAAFSPASHRGCIRIKSSRRAFDRYSTMALRPGTNGPETPSRT